MAFTLASVLKLPSFGVHAIRTYRLNQIKGKFEMLQKIIMNQTWNISGRNIGHTRDSEWGYEIFA